MRNNRTLMHVFLLFLFFTVMACAANKAGVPSGQQVQCPNGKRPLMDCRMAFDQYQRVIKFDVQLIESFGTGIGIGAQPLISLDSVTGDLLAHQHQVCMEYNNCMITQEEYIKEQRYLRHAQLKIREMANTARIGIDTPPGSMPPQLDQASAGPKVDLDKKMTTIPVSDGKEAKLDMDLNVTNPVVFDELNRLDDKMKALAKSRGVGIGTGATTLPQTADADSKKMALSYTIVARREKPNPTGMPKQYEPLTFMPGVTLKSGDQFKITFLTDRDGYVYVVNFDAAGKSQIIFPHPEAGLNNRVKAGQTYVIPSASDSWYFLDQTTGQETLYLLGSPYPIPNLDSLVNELKQPGASPTDLTLKNARLRGSLDALTRGIGVASIDAVGKNDARSSVLTAEKVEFMHQ